MSIEKLILDPKFMDLKEKQCLEVLSFLLENNYEFGVICEASNVIFNPILPDEILSKINSVTLFMLAGYSFESAFIENHELHFEAGFGPNNFESSVTIPIESIIQIVLEQSVLFMNVSAGEKRHHINKETNEQAIEHSMNVFASNPDNSKFFHK